MTAPLPDTVLIVVGARSGLPARGTRRLVLTAGPDGAILTDEPALATPALALVVTDPPRHPTRAPGA